jgi:hypothetical protein
MEKMDKETKEWGCAIAAVVGLALVLIVAFMAGMPTYRVWQRGLKGKSELREAEWSRKIRIEEAKARRASVELDAQTRLIDEKAKAQSEIARARGVAEANRIIGDSLKGNDSYLRYLWIQGLNDGTSEVIYIPTEANLPILEATRAASVDAKQ